MKAYQSKINSTGNGLKFYHYQMMEISLHFKSECFGKERFEYWMKKGDPFS